jgi:predicted nucleotidyltransferase
MAIEEILQECKAILEGYYGSHFQGLLLYGSVARGQAGPDSDIDLLVLLSRPFDYFDELRQIVELLYPIQLESDRLISAKPVSVDEFKSGRIQFYRNAKREGVTV